MYSNTIPTVGRLAGVKIQYRIYVLLKLLTFPNVEQNANFPDVKKFFPNVKKLFPNVKKLFPNVDVNIPNVIPYLVCPYKAIWVKIFFIFFYI